MADHVRSDKLTARDERERRDDKLRDAAALYRVLLNRDRDGARAILNITDCLHCLAAEVAMVGIMLANAVSQPPGKEDSDDPSDYLPDPAPETKFDGHELPVVPWIMKMNMEAYLDGLIM